MAKMKRPIGDMVSGKVGNVVFFRHNEQAFVKAAPQRKQTSWTPDQQLHRQRFSAGAKLWRDAKSAQLTDIWNRGSGKMNGYALFMKANMPAFSLDGSLTDPRMIQLSTGRLHLPQKLEAWKPTEEGTTIAVSWQNDPLLKGERLLDQLMVVSRTDGMFSIRTATGLVRNASQGTFELPQAPGILLIYLFFTSSDKKDYSPSACFEV